jgi:hypothetical protein|tara:strand:- start:457 stop:660 length:204 start_codon:yes stop_codon:yes gene_type:complete
MVDLKELTEFKAFLSGVTAARLADGQDWAKTAEELPWWVEKFRLLEPQRTSEKPDADIRRAFAEVDG